MSSLARCFLPQWWTRQEMTESGQFLPDSVFFFNQGSHCGQKEAHGALGQRSLANTRCADTPHVLPVRGCLEEVKRLMRGDFHIGRGSRQRSLKRSTFANDFKVSEFGREIAISKFREKMAADGSLQSTFRTLSGARLICNCSARQDCHADAVNDSYRIRFQGAFDRSADSGITPRHKFSITRHSHGKNLKVNQARRQMREFRDPGQDGSAKENRCWWARVDQFVMACPSPGRWVPHARKYPTAEHWKLVAGHFLDFARKHGSADLSTKFALGRVEESSSPLQFPS